MSHLLLGARTSSSALSAAARIQLQTDFLWTLWACWRTLCGRGRPRSQH